MSDLPVPDPTLQEAEALLALEARAEPVIHRTAPLRVWIDCDEGIADMVRRLNELPGVRTHASCQGTIGEGGPHPYPAHVMVSWETANSLEQIRREYDVITEGDYFGYVVRRGTKWGDRP